MNYDYTEGPQTFPMLGPTLWPADLEFKRVVSNYYQAALGLGRQLFGAFALGLGLPEDTFLKRAHHPTSQLRLIHYPYDEQESQHRQGIGAHTDYECFTLLYPTTSGLEVLNNRGEWIPVPHSQDRFVINIGDMLEVLSNGAYVATTHRVKTITRERYSFPLFCALDYDAVVQPLEGCESVSGRVYDSVVCGEHLYAQTIQSFSYLQERLKRGEIQMPEGSKALLSYGAVEKGEEGASI